MEEKRGRDREEEKIEEEVAELTRGPYVRRGGARSLEERSGWLPKAHRRLWRRDEMEGAGHVSGEIGTEQSCWSPGGEIGAERSRSAVGCSTPVPGGSRGAGTAEALGSGTNGDLRHRLTERRRT
ncbi:hornerin-like [Iris pallida]|uniref:Hornerin-like n=1 Tax=Iris pallida TaxID=29817 RepID=A0AAX6FH86_IRIPA|nr:hornerin-like [Iris pallida]